jgi:cyclophilin family peptidyl-prolyl cis-trans isomerase
LEKKDTKLLGNEIFEKCKDRSAQIVSAAIRIWYKTNPTDAAAEMWKRYSDATTIYDKVHYAHALGVNPNLASGCVEAISTSKEYPVKNALTEALIEMHTSTNWPNNLDFNTTATSLILDGDIGVQALLAGHFRELKFNETEKQPIITALTEALGKLSLPREIETYNEIIKTLNVLSDQKREEKKVEFNHPIDWKEVSGISSKQVAKITTSKGVIQMELRVNDAPGSVSNFVKLAKEGFYNDKYFHRVISNFVIQGGCPRGDGMGSTDYTIRSEFALHNYSEGAVGLASSGRDTESCQWFITHGYTPHLEGRYTIFAYVTSGMEVVKKIQIGDQILKVEIIE